MGCKQGGVLRTSQSKEPKHSATSMDDVTCVVVFVVSSVDLARLMTYGSSWNELRATARHLSFVVMCLTSDVVAISSD